MEYILYDISSYGATGGSSDFSCFLQQLIGLIASLQILQRPKRFHSLKPPILATFLKGDVDAILGNFRFFRKIEDFLNFEPEILVCGIMYGARTDRSKKTVNLTFGHNFRNLLLFYLRHMWYVQTAAHHHPVRMVEHVKSVFHQSANAATNIRAISAKMVFIIYIFIKSRQKLNNKKKINYNRSKPKERQQIAMNQ